MGSAAKLTQVQALIDAGMCVSAAIHAEDLRVQFNARTLRRWRREAGYRRTYAVVVEMRSEGRAVAGVRGRGVGGSPGAHPGGGPQGPGGVHPVRRGPETVVGVGADGEES